MGDGGTCNKKKSDRAGCEQKSTGRFSFNVIELMELNMCEVWLLFINFTEYYSMSVCYSS